MSLKGIFQPEVCNLVSPSTEDSVYQFSVAAVTSYHKFSSLTKNHLSSYSFCGSEVQPEKSAGYPITSQGEIKVSAALCSAGSRGEFLPAQSSYWQNSDPCGCRNEVPISLLAVTSGLFLLQQPLIFLDPWPFLNLQSQQLQVEFVLCIETLLPFFLCISLMHTPAFCYFYEPI